MTVTGGGRDLRLEPERAREAADERAGERRERRRRSENLSQGHGLALQAPAHRRCERRVGARVAQEIDELLVRRTHEQRTVLQECGGRAPLGAAQELASVDEQLGAPGDTKHGLPQQPPFGIELRTRQRGVDAQGAQSGCETASDAGVCGR
jgi:hypothetical protein